jgi:hypothetical protein
MGYFKGFSHTKNNNIQDFKNQRYIGTFMSLRERERERARARKTKRKAKV